MSITQESVAKLNLARKLRSAHFDAIIGQNLVVRMLKNSLYLNQFFPVYLFSGQRGCGKTTTARVFAAALNCEKLSEFQKSPKSVQIPCLECVSCLAMKAGNHPDFIEIDAASHTGVDNVRMIIEAAHLLPVMGRKKIYLIDEAHMLSKAAFNAFLKILEEPPKSVIFMLATTDVHKIIDTVKSRCFQLFFGAVASQILVDYLQTVCKQEEITFEDKALALIVKETEGSVRDALNLLEQIRFSHSSVSYAAALAVLGSLPDDHIVGILELIIKEDQVALLQYVASLQLSSYSPLVVWAALQENIQKLIYYKSGIEDSFFKADKESLLALSRDLPLSLFVSYLKIIYEYEALLLKTTESYGLLELMLLTLCEQKIANSATPVQLKKEVAVKQNVAIAQELPIKSERRENLVVAAPDKKAVAVEEKKGGSLIPEWNNFLTLLEGYQDPFVASLFKQAECALFERETGTLKVLFPKTATFFMQWLEDKKAPWNDLLDKAFATKIILVTSFELAAQSAVPKEGIQQTQSAVVKKDFSKEKTVSLSQNKSKVTMVDISDKDQWKLANTLVDAFGGIVVEEHTDGKTS